MKSLVMGTRGSPLALAQARQFARSLEKIHPGLRVEERIIKTTGDKNQISALPQIGGKGVFTFEIERALLQGEIHFAVHSLKDLPPLMPEGLALACVPQRENASDCLVINDLNVPEVSASGGALKILPLGAKIGTSSLRRRAMLLHLRPDLKIEDVRGNIDTRLRKLSEEGFHAVILARAGLNRLEVNHIETLDLPQSHFIPAPGQGALAIQARSADLDTRQILMGLEHDPTRAAISAERALLEKLGAGCSTPLGAIALASGDLISMHCALLSVDGKTRIAVSVQGSGAPEIIGRRAADSLLEKGANRLLSL